MKRWLKAELHSHTAEDPEDGGHLVTHSTRELIDRAANQRFEVLAITNHNQLLYTESLRRYAEERGILLIPGVEASLQAKHVLLYNFLDYTPDWNRPGQVARSKNEDRLVIAPHPFFPGASSLGRRFLDWIELFDAIEFNHFYLPQVNFNRKAEEAASRYRIPLVGNSDVHHLFQLGSTFSMIYAEKDLRSVIQSIKEGEVRVVTQPLNTAFIAHWAALAALAFSRKTARSVSGSLRSLLA